MQKQQFPQDGFLGGEKAILEESYEPSLGKLRWPAFFMTVYPTVQYQISNTKSKYSSASIELLLKTMFHESKPLNKV